MDIIYGVFQFIPPLLHDNYAERNGTASSLCSTQCLSNMPIPAIDWVKIYRSNGRLPKPHFDKSLRIPRGVTKHYLWRGLFSSTENVDIDNKRILGRNNILFWWPLTQCCLFTPCLHTDGHTKAYTMTQSDSQMHAWVHQCTRGDTHAHAPSLMRDFLTFLHVPLENIDESPFKNNSPLVGSLNDLQLFHQHIIITFIMLDCAG